MKRNRIILVLLMFLLLAMTGTVYASDTSISVEIPTLGEAFFVSDTSKFKTVWMSDLKTGAQVGYVLKEGLTEDKPLSVSWTGPIVNGKAEGKGTLVIVFKREIQEKKDQNMQLTSFHQIIQTTIQGEAEMVGGMLEGAASLKTLVENTNLSRGDKSSYSGSFDGFFASGLEEGLGKKMWMDKVLFDGQWKAGGEDSGYLMKTGGRAWAYTFEGEIRDGKANGTGKVTVRNIGSYQGEFKDGKYEGKGVWRYRTIGQVDLSRADEIMGGASFQGSFSNDKPNGYGVFKDGRGQVIYEGEWRDSKPAK